MLQKITGLGYVFLTLVLHSGHLHLSTSLAVSFLGAWTAGLRDRFSPSQIL